MKDWLMVGLGVLAFVFVAPVMLKLWAMWVWWLLPMLTGCQVAP